jgi:hypothetical protein
VVTLQLRKAREDELRLVQVHWNASNKHDLLQAELRSVVDQLINARREGSAIELTSNTKLTAKDRVISELYAKIVQLAEIDPCTRLPGN